MDPATLATPATRQIARSRQSWRSGATNKAVSIHPLHPLHPALTRGRQAIKLPLHGGIPRRTPMAVPRDGPQTGAKGLSFGIVVMIHSMQSSGATGVLSRNSPP
jgi:hypothetical protein